MIEMNLSECDISVLAPERKNRVFKYKSNPHPMKNFLRERGIPQAKAAKAVGCDQPSLSRVLNNRTLMDPELEKKLLDLQVKILNWERTNNKKFGE
jgi:hypothetical protein